MTDVYEKCPDIETDKVLLRPACKEDSGQLLKIYSGNKKNNIQEKTQNVIT